MNNTNQDLTKLLTNSTIYCAIKHDVESGCSKASDQFGEAVFHYMNKIYRPKAYSDTTNDFNFALAYDTNNEDLISDQTLHFLKKWEVLCNNYNKLAEKYPSNEVRRVIEFNKIVVSTYIRYELDLKRHCKISKIVTVTEEKTKREYVTYKPTCTSISLDQDQSNSKDSDDIVILYDCIPSNSLTPEDESVSSVIISEIATYLSNKSPRLLLAFVSKYSGMTVNEMEYELNQKQSWRSFFQYSISQFAALHNCHDLPRLFANAFSEKELTYTFSTSTLYAERTLADTLVRTYVLTNGLYVPKNSTYTRKK